MLTASIMLRALCRQLSRASFAVAIALIGHDADADINSKERFTALAKLPDWTGIWESAVGSGASSAASKPANGAAAFAHPAALPYNSTWQGKIEATQKKKFNASAGEQTADNTVTQCIWGMPRIFGGPYTFEITVLPEQTFINYDVGEYRHIWTDGRKQPLLTAPTEMGHSIGHWEGETLVVYTVGLKSGIWVNSAGATLSDKASIEERWSQIDKDHLKVEVTIQDPLALLKPYAATHRYQRVVETNRQLQQNCFENMLEVMERDQAATKFTR